MSATKPLAILLAVLVAATGVGAAVGSTHDTGDGAYAMDAQLDDGLVTVTVTHDGDPVENATVDVADETATTDGDGRVTVERPDDEFEVSLERAGVELKHEYAVDDGSLVLEQSEFETENEEADDESEETDDESEEADDESEETDDESEDADDESEDADDESEDEGSEDESDADDGDGSAPAEAAAGGPPADAQRGPIASLPAQVPDHVSAIHELVGSFLSGDSGTPGPAVSDAAR